VETLVRLADALNVPVAQLLGREAPANEVSPMVRKLLQIAKKLHGRDLQTVIALAEDLAKRE